MGTLRGLYNNYGLSGIFAFIKIKTGFSKRIKLKNIKHKIELRPYSSDVTTFKHIFAHNDYDYEISPFPKVIIDAGANVGLASIYFANRYPSARIIAIELAPSNFKILLKNTRNYKHIEIVNAGIWNKKEVLKFEDKGVSHWGYKVNNKLEGDVISVESVTVQEILNKFSIKEIDLFKIDIEGAEIELFSENYEGWLPVVKFIMIEFHDRWRSDSSKVVRDVLQNFNFSEVGVVGENMVFVNKSIK